jgi:hypothetical protein
MNTHCRGVLPDNTVLKEIGKSNAQPRLMAALSSVATRGHLAIKCLVLAREGSGDAVEVRVRAAGQGE